MTEIKQYCVTLESAGRMTQLPDSQQMFGALVYLISHLADDETASEFVNQVKTHKNYFTLSSLLPKGYYPVPLSYLQTRASVDKETYKKIKKRQFLPLDHIKQLCLGASFTNYMYPYLSLQEDQQIHTAVDSLRYDLPGLNPTVYSTPDITAVEEKENGSQRKITHFHFYFTLVGEQPLHDCLEKAKAENYPLVLGPRSSQGLNLYYIQALKEEQELPETTSNTTFLNLGRLLPQQINFQESYFTLFTSERRPFQSWGERNQETPGQYISFIDTGSVIHLDDPTMIYKAGKSVASPFDPARSIIFGQSFLYPLAIGGQ